MARLPQVKSPPGGGAHRLSTQGWYDDEDGARFEDDKLSDATALDSYLAGQVLAFKYVWAEIRRNRRSFMIGCFTVFLVVFFVALLYNSVLQSPIIFFKLSEDTVGENDLTITPAIVLGLESAATATVSGLPAINHTLLDKGIETLPVKYSEGATPRWVLISSVTNPDSGQSSSAFILAWDSVREEELGIGREWNRPPLADGDCYISSTILRQIGMDPDASNGQDVVLNLNMLELATTLELIETDEEGNLSEEDLQLIAELVFPGVGDAWNDTISVDLLDNDLYNLTALTESPGPVNVTDVLRTLQNLLSPFVNITIPDALNNLTISANATAEAAEALLDFAIEQTLGVNGTVLETTVGDLVLAVLPGLLDSLALAAPLRIADAVGQPSGKWPSNYGSVVILEYEYATRLVRDTLLSVVDARANVSIARTFLEQLGVNTSLSQVPGLSDEIIDQLDAAIDGQVAFVNGSDTELDEAIENFNVTDYTFVSIIMFKDRVQMYLKTLDLMLHDVIRKSDEIADAYGPTRLGGFTAPVATSLDQTKWLRYFLDNIFAVVIAIITLLGVLLIYSLLLNDVEEKTYEYGMLRALGMRHRTLVQILLTKSMAFASVGIGLGLFFAFLFNIPIADFSADFAKIDPDYRLYPNAVILALVVGLVMPLIANIAPISRALSRTLRDSLDVYHHVVSDVTIRITRLANLGLDMWQTTLSLLLITFGIITFYLIPYSFQFQNFALFLGLLSAILIGMLLGLCILAQAAQPYLERFMLHVLLWGRHKRLHNVVRKNLAGHSTRNKKTALMLSISLAFILFASTMFQLQSNSLEDNVRQFWGSDLLVLSQNMKDRLRETEMSEFLDQEIARRQSGDDTAVVLGYTFVTFQMRDTEIVSSTRFSNLPNFPEARQRAFGIQSNYLDVTYSDYYAETERGSGTGRGATGLDAIFADAGGATLPEERNGQVVPSPLGVVIPPDDEDGQFDAADIPDAETRREHQERLAESYEQYVDVLMSEGLRDFMSVDTQTPLNLRVRIRGPDRNYMCKARAMAYKVPGFFFSSYRQTAWFGSLLMSEDSYARIIRESYEQQNLTITEELAPKQKLLVKVTDGATEGQRRDVINGLRTFYRSDATLSLDTRSVIADAKYSVSMLQSFFTIVSVLAMIMCFFILWLSFTANVTENAWEFGVLRSLGLSGVDTSMIYVYEALALVLAAVILGATIGIMIAISLTLQFNLFTEIPFRFDFPFSVFFSVFGMSVAVAIAASLLPTWSFAKKTIAAILRRQ